MTSIIRKLFFFCGFLLSLGTLSAAEITTRVAAATPPTGAQPAPQTIRKGKAQEMSVAKVREKVFAILDRMPADQKVQFGGRQLSAREFRAELLKLHHSEKPLHQIDVGWLRKEIERQEAARVTQANSLATEAVMALKKKMAIEKISAEKISRSLTAMTPHIDRIHKLQPAYSPGMYIVIVGSGFLIYEASYGPVPPKLVIKYKGPKGQGNVRHDFEIPLDVFYDPNPNSWATSNSKVLIVKLPDNLRGIMDQTVQGFVEAGPSGNRKKSNEVSFQFIARREAKSVDPQHIQTQFCWNVMVASCDREYQDGAANWQICKDFWDHFPQDGYAPSRKTAYNAISEYAIKTLHEARCMLSLDVAPGMDIYGFPLFNGHTIQGTPNVYGFPGSSAWPTVQAGTNAAMLTVWYSVDSALYYGINVTVVGPAGIPYHIAW